MGEQIGKEAERRDPAEDPANTPAQAFDPVLRRRFVISSRRAAAMRPYAGKDAGRFALDPFQHRLGGRDRLLVVPHESNLTGNPQAANILMRESSRKSCNL